MMLFIYILFALGLSTVGSPFPASSNEFDDPGSISSNTAGLDLFGSDTLYAAKEVPNADTIQTFSLASSPDDSLFTDDLSDFSGLGSLDPTISVNLPSDLAVVGADDNIFGSTTLDDGLSGGLFDVDGSSEPFDLAAKPSNGAAGGCVSEIFQSIGKRKRLVCPTTYTDTDTDTETDSTPDTQTETKSNNQRLPPLDETIRRIPGFDQPDLLVKEICLSAFEPVCCTGQEYLGLLQTGCSKYSVSDWGNMDCYDVKNILCCANYNGDARTASSCYSPSRDPTAYPLRKLPDYPLNTLIDDEFGSTFSPPN